MFTVPVDVSLAMAPKNCCPGLELTRVMGDQVAPSSVEVVITTSFLAQKGCPPPFCWITATSHWSKTMKVVTVLPSLSRRLIWRGESSSRIDRSPIMVSKTGFFTVFTNTGVLQVGGFGAPAGVQVTNLISSGFTPGPVVLR